MNIVANSTTPRIATTDHDGLEAVASVSRYSDHLSHRFLPEAIGTLRELDRAPITIRPHQQHTLRNQAGLEIKGGTTR